MTSELNYDTGEQTPTCQSDSLSSRIITYTLNFLSQHSRSAEEVRTWLRKDIGVLNIPCSPVSFDMHRPCLGILYKITRLDNTHFSCMYKVNTCVLGPNRHSRRMTISSRSDQGPLSQSHLILRLS